jgi:hypothetical protein
VYICEYVVAVENICAAELSQQYSGFFFGMGIRVAILISEYFFDASPVMFGQVLRCYTLSGLSTNSEYCKESGYSNVDVERLGY